MNVEVQITREDMFWMNVLTVHRTPGNLSFVIFICLGYFGMYLYRHGLSQGSEAVFGKFGEALIVAIVVFGSLFLVSLLFTIVAATKKSGVLGVHHYAIEEAGLRERTDTNDTLQRWSGITDIFKTGRFILVRVNWYLFHILPRRCFQSEEEFCSFYSELHRKWKDAA